MGNLKFPSCRFLRFATELLRKEFRSLRKQNAYVRSSRGTRHHLLHKVVDTADQREHAGTVRMSV